MSRTPVLSIIVPVYNQFEYTQMLLTDLHKVTTPFELIIIDNASEDKTETFFTNRVPYYDYLVDYKYLRQDRNIYVNPAWNLWVSQASWEYIMIINNDITIDAVWFEKPLINALFDNVMISSPLYTVWEDTISNDKIWYQNNRYNPNNICGHCFVMRKEHYPVIPESLRIWFWDNFIYETMKKRGMIQVVCPDSTIHHFESKTVKNSNIDAVIATDKAHWFMDIAKQFTQ